MSDPDYQLIEPEKSLGDLAGRLTQELGDLVSAHVDLAKTEIKEEVAKAGRGAGLLGGGALAALVAVIFVSTAAGWGLAEWMAPGWAFLIVGLAWTIAALIMAYTGREQMRDVEPMPKATVEEIERDKEWLKQQPN